jgi:hypothetical protein
MDSPRPFTALHDDQFDSDAYRLLSPLARNLLVEFARLEARARDYDVAAHAPPICFAWASCPLPCDRQTFRRARSELLKFGFMTVANEMEAIYRSSRRYRRYEASAAERALLDKDATVKAASSARSTYRLLDFECGAKT